MPRTEFLVAMTEDTDAALRAHLDPGDREEDLTFATWSPSTGNKRFTAIIRDIILPGPGDRVRHGNVHLNHPYLERAAAFAASRGLGLALLHSHPGARSWQRLSPDDAETEGMRIAAYAAATTGLHFVGLTLSTESGFWSARRWNRIPVRGKPSRYAADHALAVKVVGKRLRYHANPNFPTARAGDELTRTRAVWGEEAQSSMGRLRFAVIGLGSVGSIISEGLARLGATDVRLIDFDVIKPHNRDRTLHASLRDAFLKTSKARLAARHARRAATMPGFRAKAILDSVVTPNGAQQLLDCDVIFSCVDRPWPRHVLNATSYAHLIPVIDGGIVVRFREQKFDGMDWRTQTSGPQRACLACTGAYRVHLVNVERDGLLDDPSYIQGLPPEERPSSENILPLSLGLAGQELVQFIHLLAGFKGLDDVGVQAWHYSPPMLESNDQSCIKTCDFAAMTGIGDAMPIVTGQPVETTT